MYLLTHHRNLHYSLLSESFHLVEKQQLSQTHFLPHPGQEECYILDTQMYSAHLCLLLIPSCPLSSALYSIFISEWFWFQLFSIRWLIGWEEGGGGEEAGRGQEQGLQVRGTRVRV